MIQWLIRLFERLLEWLRSLFPLPVPSRQHYEVVPIPAPSGSLQSRALDISDDGTVVGSRQIASGGLRAFSWKNGTLFDIGALGPESMAYAINNARSVGGQTQHGSGVDARGFVVPAGTALAAAHDVGTLGGANSVVLAMGDDGCAAGWADVGTDHHAFLLVPGAGLQDLTPGLVGFSSAEAVLGEYIPPSSGPLPLVPPRIGRCVVGYTQGPTGDVAFRWTEEDGLQPMVTPGATSSRAYGCRRALSVMDSPMARTWSASYVVVGEANFGGGSHAVQWSGNNVTDLGTLGGATSVAYDIGLEYVVGASETADGSRHAFIWSAGGPMVDLNTLIPANSGWVLNEARAINQRGQIVGIGTYQGRQQGFLLS